MPKRTQEAVDWSLGRKITNAWGFKIEITKDEPIYLVESVRDYFNSNDIEYGSFSYDDLTPYFN